MNSNGKKTIKMYGNAKVLKLLLGSTRELEKINYHTIYSKCSFQNAHTHKTNAKHLRANYTHRLENKIKENS